MKKTIYQQLMESGKTIPQNKKEAEEIRKFNEEMERLEWNRQHETGPNILFKQKYHSTNLTKYTSYHKSPPKFIF